MHALLTFMRKEWTECIRSGKLILLVTVFVFFGILNPATAKLLPFLLQSMTDSFSKLGVTVVEQHIDAMTSWEQFFKNVPMALTAFVLIFSSIFTKEYQSGTMVLTLTKGVPRYVIVAAKSLFLFVSWTASFYLSFGITYAYNAFYWDNSIAVNLAAAAALWYGFGLLILCAMILFSGMLSNNGTVLLATGFFVAVCSTMNQFPSCRRFSPTCLTDAMPILAGTASPSDYATALVTAVVLGCVCLAAGIGMMNIKQL